MSPIFEVAEGVVGPVVVGCSAPVAADGRARAGPIPHLRYRLLGGGVEGLRGVEGCVERGVILVLEV